MIDIVNAVFRKTLEHLVSELEGPPATPLARWNESVFRYYFCRFLGREFPEVKEFVECDWIDLVLHEGSVRAFVEFKFYLRRPRFDPYSGKRVGSKGGPSKQNQQEFQNSISRLSERASKPGLEVQKYVVLVYADALKKGQAMHTFAQHYDDYSYPHESVTVEVADSFGPITTDDEDRLAAKLYRIS